MIDTRLRDSVTIVRAPIIAGPYNSNEFDWSAATRVSVRAEVQPLSSSEDMVGQDRTLTRWRVFLPPTADLVYTDRVEHDGATYEVDGDVERHKLRGILHHLEAVLQKVSGG